VGNLNQPRLSPDEKRVAYLKDEDTVGASTNQDVWILDLERGSSTRLTYGGVHNLPVWSPDGSEIAYASRENFNTNMGWQIFKRKSDGSGPQELVLRQPPDAVFPSDWSRDGRFLVILKSNRYGKETLEALPLGKGAAAVPISLSGATDFTETQGRLSPDGHYLAYFSNETGRNEVYVRTFAPDPGGQPAGKWLISNSGGLAPQWTSDGKKLLWPFEGKIYGASIDTTHGFHAGVPELVYFGKEATAGASLLTSKGQALLLKPVGEPVEEPIHVLVNWMSAIKPN
jgi:Tol biopolymer transport system component